MSARCDLHTHTTASDGQYTPGELVKKAKGHGLSILAVTDHDTIAGGSEAMAAGSTHLVIGRPITQAQDPMAALLAIEQELAAG